MKNSLRIISMILALTLMSGMLANDLGAAEDNARIEMILVQAGNGDGGVDSSLKPYAGTLQRLFRFKSYRQIKKQGMNLSIPGSTSASLGSGQTLKISADESGYRVETRWKEPPAYPYPIAPWQPGSPWRTEKRGWDLAGYFSIAVIFLNKAGTAFVEWVNSTESIP